MNARRIALAHAVYFCICAGLFLGSGTTVCHAAPLGYAGGTLSENFDFPKLAKEPDAFTEPFPTAGLPGWDSDQDDYVVMDGTTTSGALYSFGTLSADDRALGAIASSATGVVFYGLELRNDTANSYTGFSLGYTGEQWRQTTAAQNTLNFQFSLTASSISSSLGYTGVPALDFAALHFGATGGIDGNLPANRTALSAPVSFGAATWDPGETLFIRWRDPDDTGADQGLGIDDMTFLAVPEPATLLLALAGMFVLGAHSIRRRRSITPQDE